MRKSRLWKTGAAVLTAVCVAGSSIPAMAEFSFGKPGEKKEETTEAAEEETEALEDTAEETEQVTENVAEETDQVSEETTGDLAQDAEEAEEDAALSGDETGEDADQATEEIAEIPTQEEKETTSVPDIAAVAENVMPAIVAITNVGIETINYYGMEYEMDSESTGSGIIVGKNDTELLIATNNHVVEDAEELTVCFSVDTENEEDKLVSAQVKGTDSSWDLAVIAVKLEDITSDVADKIGIVQMGDSDEVEVGEWAIAIGNALGYGQSVTFGIISALDREVSVSTNSGVVTNQMIQTDAAINFGNSGGALLNIKGELIGINSAKAAETGVEGMGYAIPINTAKPIIEDLMNQTTREKVDEDKAGALGIVPVDVSEEARQIYNIPSGAFVYELTENSAAEKAGIREGDIITKLDKTAISSKSELMDRMEYYEAGETVEVTIKRAGSSGYEEMVIEVVLGRKSDLPNYSSSEQSQEEETEESTEEEYYSYGYQGGGQNSYGYGGNSGLGDLFRYFGF